MAMDGNSDNKTLRVLELFSGIGGAHMALKESKVDFEVVAAVDINTSANEVYRHNFPDTPVLQRNIESLSLELLSQLRPNMLWMSPPCQPFTRNGLKRDCKDLRTQPFLHVLELIDRFPHKPFYILLENVQGFETSNARNDFVKTLRENNYVFQEFLLNPVQFGVPNSRLRYYLLAKQKPMKFTFPERDEILYDIPIDDEISATIQTRNHRQKLTRVLQDHLEANAPYDVYKLPEKVLLRFANLLDVVKPSDNNCCCFTKAYGHYVEGAGSVLQLNEALSWAEVYEAASKEDSDDKKLRLFQEIRLRYFTPREISSLMGFPSQFEFPKSFKSIQCYRLLGNSLNVHIVSKLINLIASG